MAFSPNVDRLDADDPRWLEALASTAHDFYHLPGYVALEADRMAGQAAAYVAEQGDALILAPVVIRQVPGTEGATDLSSPYGYPAPLFRSPTSEQTPHLLAALIERLRHDGHCAAFFRLHPLMHSPQTALAKLGHVVDHGETVWVDLSESEEQQWSSYRSVNRNLIRRLKREDYSVRWDDDWSSFEEFLRLYEGTMRGVSAADWYFFSREYFDGLRRVLGPALRLCVVEREKDVIVAGLFTEVRGVVQYHLSGADPSHRRLSPTRLMLDHVRSWATARGNRAFHLGGGLGGEADSLFKFKAGFSKKRARFHTWRVKIDDDVYDRLVSSWEAAAGQTHESSDGFFPAYRKPVAPKTGDRVGWKRERETGFTEGPGR